MYNIITSKDRLSKPCVEVSLEEGLRVGNTLLDILGNHKTGVGLAANQVGINKRVCVVNVLKPIILVNPKIVGKFGKIIFKEGCLSFPGDYIITERYADIAITSENHSGLIYFSASKNKLECVCVQHEIDHLNGITMFDRQTKEK
jgi:peptide deformylase